MISGSIYGWVSVSLPGTVEFLDRENWYLKIDCLQVPKIKYLGGSVLFFVGLVWRLKCKTALQKESGEWHSFDDGGIAEAGRPAILGWLISGMLSCTGTRKGEEGGREGVMPGREKNGCKLRFNGPSFKASVIKMGMLLREWPCPRSIPGPANGPPSESEAFF